MNIAKINKTTNIVENMEVWDSVPEDTTEYSYYEETGADIGYIRNGVNDYTNPNPSVISIDELRAIRNQKLEESDWVALRRAEGRDPTGFDWNSWDMYRQALRDITEGYTNTAEEAINWPIAPS